MMKPALASAVEESLPGNGATKFISRNSPLLRRRNLIIGFSALGGLAYLSRSVSAPPAYEWGRVERGAVIRSVAAYGVAQALESVKVGCEVSGLIEQVLVPLNARVRKGELLVTVQSLPLREAARRAEARTATALAILEQRRAELARAEVDMQQKERMLKRQQKTRSEGFISAASLEDAQLTRDLAAHELQAAKSRLQAADIDWRDARNAQDEAARSLSRSRILAPMDGIIIARHVEPGQTLTAGFQTPLLFDLASDLKRMRLHVRVDEADIGQVALGQVVQFSVDTFAQDRFSGLVEAIERLGRVADGGTHFVVHVLFDNPAERVLPGMTVNVRIITGQAENVLRVSNAALQFTPPETSSTVLPRVLITTPAGAERLKRSSAASSRPAANGSRLWVSDPEQTGGLSAVEIKAGLRGDDFTELTGDEVAIGEQVALRTKPRVS